MIFCVINVDILTDDYFLRFVLDFQNEKICKNIIKKINDGKYNSDFAKNCVLSELSIDDNYINNSTQIYSENDAIKFVENFFKDYKKGLTYLEEQYKMSLIYFEDKYDYSDEDFSDY